ncbi:MAG TPA: SDR family NAD(P)-dependent oxidoreductase [Alphaproteobacteria bacterium]|nr:SDR family NAD(P)-dependent oxidoreductase [Alphaproteobacteria bacterium]
MEAKPKAPFSGGLDLGIAGRTAIVCGASAGLGRECARYLGQAGVRLVINGRDAGRLEAAAEELRRATGSDVRIAVGDVATETGRKAILAVCPDPDILVNNAGGPPPGDFREWNEEIWISALRTNMLAAIMMIQSVVDGMIARRWGRIINITSQTVKMPLPLIGLSNGSRAGLTGFVAGVAREVAQHGVTINNLLPGYFETERLRAYAGRVGRDKGKSADETIAEMSAGNPTRRIGRPAEFGAWCAFIASEHAGYATGQNFVLDGGAYPGTL